MTKFFKRFKRGIVLSVGIFAILIASGCGVQYADEKDENGARVVTNSIESDTTFTSMFEEGNLVGKLYNGLLVWPISKSITFIGETTGSYGVAIILSTVLVRLLALPLTLKSSKQQKKQAALQPKVKKIQMKYADKKDRDSMMRQNQEIQALYKESGVSMAGGCLGMLVTMPLFIAFYSAIMRTPGTLHGEFLTLDLGLTPSTAITVNGMYIYILPMVLVFAANFFSMKYTQNANKPPKSDVKRPYNAAEEKTPNMMQTQMKMMTYFMPIMMAFISWTLPVGVSVYFFASSLVALFQAYLVKRVN